MDPDDHFMTYATFRKVFKSLPASSAHRAFRSYFERRADVIGGGGKQKQSDDGPRRATAAEVFGALALAAPVDAGRKVRFLFLLHDRDKDQRLNEVELRIAVASASRGLARAAPTSRSSRSTKPGLNYGATTPHSRRRIIDPG